MCQRIQAQAARGDLVLITRQDNVGENKKLEKRLKIADWKLLVKTSTQLQILHSRML
jgi:hypothetical protein